MTKRGKEVGGLVEQRKMGGYMKKWNGVVEIAVVELAEIGSGVRKRERSLATAKKRIRDVGDGESDLASAYVELRSTRRRVVMAETTSVSSVDGLVSCGARNSAEVMNCAFEPSSLCSSSTSSELVEDQTIIADPAVRTEASDGLKKSAQIEILTFSGDRERSYTSPSSESGAEKSDDMESTASRPSMEANSCDGSVVHEMPSESEIEEFFAAAEKDLQKRFSEKYNFDIVNGVPLEGCYDWVRVEGHERS